MANIRGYLSRKKTDVYVFLKKHPFLDALQYVVRNCKNSEICRDIARRNGLQLKCFSYGEHNKERNIYYIQVGKPEFGFFALFRITLKYLVYAERFGFVPVIKWSKNISFAERKAVLGTDNPFEYYFKQPGQISIEEAEESYNVFAAEEVHITDFFLNKEIPKGEEGYVMSEEYMEYLARIVKRFIHLNEWTESYLKDQIEKVVGKRRTIGVHVRGSDFKKGYNNHPAIVSVDDYLDATKSLFEEGDYEQVFLATDDAGAIKRFQDIFGDKLVFYSDVIRTDGVESVAFSQSERENHHYLLGLEVLRDMYSLTFCDGLVAGISQVSNCARIVKKSYETEYKDKIILNKIVIK